MNNVKNWIIPFSFDKMWCMTSSSGQLLWLYIEWTNLFQGVNSCQLRNCQQIYGWYIIIFVYLDQEGTPPETFCFSNLLFKKMLWQLLYIYIYFYHYLRLSWELELRQLDDFLLDDLDTLLISQKLLFFFSQFFLS